MTQSASRYDQTNITSADFLFLPNEIAKEAIPKNVMQSFVS
jgi:hypothetical protein